MPDAFWDAILPKFRGYAVERQLATAADGDRNCYLARDLMTSRLVVLKTSPLRSSKTYLADLARREAELLMGLSHENLVRAIGVFEERDQHVLATEYVEGCDLRDYLRWRGGVLEIEEVLGIMVPLGNLYAHLHEVCGLAWVDAAPQNVLVSRDGQPMVRDVESLRPIGDRENPFVLRWPYTPPEFKRGEPITPTVDIFGWGATLATLVAGEVRIADSWPGSISLEGTRVLLAVQDVVRRCVDPEPARRFGTMREAVHALERAMAAEQFGSRPTMFLRHFVARKLAGGVSP